MHNLQAKVYLIFYQSLAAGRTGAATGLHGMDTFASSSCNDIVIGSTTPGSLSPAIFSSRKLLNDAVIMMCYLQLSLKAVLQ